MILVPFQPEGLDSLIGVSPDEPIPKNQLLPGRLVGTGLADGSFQVFRTTQPQISDLRMPGMPQTICRPASGCGAASGERGSRNLRPCPHRIVVLGSVISRPGDHADCACQRRWASPSPPQQEHRTGRAPLPRASAQTAGDVYAPVPLRPEQPVRRSSCLRVTASAGEGRLAKAEGPTAFGPRIPRDGAHGGPFITDTAIAGKRFR